MNNIINKNNDNTLNMSTNNAPIKEFKGAIPLIKKKKAINKQQTLFLFLILLIPTINWLIFFLYVNFNTVLLAFENHEGNFVGIKNFIDFFSEATSPYKDLHISIRNTFFYFGASIFFVIPLSIFASYFIYKRVFLYKAFRIIFYLPAIVSGLALVMVYSSFIDARGPLSAFLNLLFGIQFKLPGFLYQTSTATTAIIVFFVWTGLGTNILIFGGAMSRIPLEILESARLEGCGSFRELIQIIFPLIWSTFSTVFILAMTSIFTVGGPILLFENSHNYEVSTISFWIFKQVYGTGQVGGTGMYNLVSAAGVFFTLVATPIILIVRKLVELVPTVEY